MPDRIKRNARIPYKARITRAVRGMFSVRRQCGRSDLVAKFPGGWPQTKEDHYYWGYCHAVRDCLSSLKYPSPKGLGF